jgi:hypothetical protein
MSLHDRLCHGQFDCLQTSSSRRPMNSMLKVYQKLRSYLVWHIENMGLSGTLRRAFIAVSRTDCPAVLQKKTASTETTALGLKPGELVEVKSIEDIMSTLDANRKNRGLLWMTGMRKFCGKRYRVLRNVRNIVLESNGELRKMTDTVILEGVVCDGVEFCGCDRSCFHFWREAWLRRVEQEV